MFGLQQCAFEGTQPAISAYTDVLSHKERSTDMSACNSIVDQVSGDKLIHRQYYTKILKYKLTTVFN